MLCVLGRNLLSAQFSHVHCSFLSGITLLIVSPDENVTGNGSHNGAMHAQSCWFMKIAMGFNLRPGLYSRKYAI